MERGFRHVMRIQATDSPNVRLGLAEQRCNLSPSGKRLYQGVLSWHDYQFRMATWDENRISVGILAQWYEGAELLLYPLPWLNRCADAGVVDACRRAPAEALGVDPGEGVANTSWSVVNKYGLKELISYKTPDTTKIVTQTLDLKFKHNIAADKICFDRGSGKQHADLLRSRGHDVRTVAFGEVVSLEPKRGLRLIQERREHLEERYQYKNRRAYMYGEFSQRLDPSINDEVFAIPDHGSPAYIELRRQLGAMPKRYDEEGRMFLPPKNRVNEESTKETLTDILGHSPDEADSLMIAYYVMTHKSLRPKAGAM